MNDTICTTADPAVALAREAAVNYQIKIMGSILGVVAAFWLVTSVFFLYHFYSPTTKDWKVPPSPPPPRPLPPTPRQEEEDIELRDMSREQRDAPEWWSRY
ncbi:hypothetical protein HD806DRAFT_69097 [Xylariaceae sp. AK1471]|nr:hypothetical protein HD806DRAFT_69097 [Xylariaceae sp. AK1471]